MLTRILNSKLPLMIYNPVKTVSIKFFKKIFKAGVLPVFNTEFLSENEIIETIKKLARKNILFGLRVGTHDRELIREISKIAPVNLDLLVVPFGLDDEPADFSLFSNTKIALEIRDININDKIKEISPHALILKGNEACGRVSKYSSFILMQWYLKNSELPVFIHGGVGQHTAAGMFAAGVSGVVLDSQVWLADESPVSDNFKKLLMGLDESDSIEITINSNTRFRVFAKLGTKIAKELKEKAIVVSDRNDAEKIIYQEIKNNITALDEKDAMAVQSLFYLGQDALFAKNFVKKSTNLKEIISSFFKYTGEALNLVDRFDPIKPDSPLAKEHGTDLPLIQGPMANITDNAEFASKVLKAGALPFFAVGSLPANLADEMLKKGTEKTKICGAGLVGITAFNPAVEQHLEMVKKYNIPFALFAGGVPAQVLDLEKHGTKTYLHTPSVSMMENAKQNGCTRFIFEGTEAGGHVGSLTSLVLWEAAISKLLEPESQVPETRKPEEKKSEEIESKLPKVKDTETKKINHAKANDLSHLTLIFAGGISTCFASCFISGISSLLASKGAKIGIQVGSAYLFSTEIVETKSIKGQYQEIISQEDETMVIGTTIGLASRTAPTEFAKMMIKTEKEMIKKGEKLEAKKRAFEQKNIGSLLIGAKGFLPDFKNPGPENFKYFHGEEHREHGNFLVGESLAFFKKSLSIKDIHSKYFNAKDLLFKNLADLEIFSSEKNQINDEIAVIGMGCILPGADSYEKLWDNILDKKHFIKEMPTARMDKDLYYDPDKKAEDKSYTKIAGLIEDFKFDQERFGYDDEKTAKLSRSQQLLLQTAYQAVEDSGCLGDDLKFSCKNPEKVSVVIATCLSNELGNDLQFKYHFPEVIAMLQKDEEFQKLKIEEKEELIKDLQKGMEGKNRGYDPVHGMLLNIEASRVARHLGIRGANYIVDAACASSFTALEAGCDALLSGESDHVIVGGVNTNLTPEAFIGFCKMGALSAEGSFPFDERANGFILGEGSSVFVLKRMKDAVRDNDNIHGIIKGIGSSSDGRGKSIAAPNIAGQLFSLERCYEKLKSDIKPGDIRFIEAHGTSTIMGDQAELETLKEFYKDAKTGISSVKSQIGHLLGSAGAAGLLKALLAVKKGIIPPSANFKKLSKNHNIDDSQLYIVTEQEKWEEPEDKTRKAAISSYGFGGINYHIVIEEFRNDYTLVKRSIFENPDYDFNDDRIVIAGLGVFLPGARNVDSFWEKLESGEKQLTDIPEDIFSNKAYAKFDEKSIYHLPMVKAGVIHDFKFNNAKYRMPPKTTRSIEKGQLYGLEAADEAITSAGLGEHLKKGNKIGVILGTIPGERQTKNILRVRKELIGKIIQNSDAVSSDKSRSIAEKLVEQIRERIPENNEDTTPGLLSNIISGRIANHFGLNGANYVVDASCASAVVAIRNAARSVAFKNLDFVLAGGVDANLFPAVLMAFKRLGLLSKGDCNYFDSRADGYVMGEGAAIHVVTTYRKAIENNMEILGEINQTCIKSSAPDHLLAPSEQTFVSTINDCYQKSGIKKEELSHIDLFAFSNFLGDMIEKQVVEKSFDHADHTISCGNVKPQFGYFKAANPAVALAKVMLMNKKRKLLPDFNYSEEHSTIKNSTVLKPAKELVTMDCDAWGSPVKPLRLATNVNGIGGNHSHMIISTLPANLVRMQNADESVQEPGFEDIIEIKSRKDQQKQEQEYSVTPHYAADSMAVSSTVIDLNQETDKTHKAYKKDMTIDYSHGSNPYSADSKGNKQRMVALLSGQGAQRAGMMKELFERDPDIRNTMERGEEVFVKARGYSLLDIMFKEDQRLNLTENTQPAVFLASAALFDKLNSQGFNPDFFIGHSIGEYTAL
ncbi:MAG: beta-ketoacyl synthase N-terminal-like domain-containing protein, partial [Thermodesulfobacteriota bacterium]|nr:beta-ketoacyl synthase N-terminal-like domain-containing protein [Thermodesulfobacteriota bacterium]